MLIVIHFNPLRSFFNIRDLQTVAREAIYSNCKDILHTTAREYIL